MEDQYFGMKQLYQVVLKTTDKMKIGNRYLEKGEPVTYFDNVQIASITENITPVYAKGGKGNNTLVVWQDRNDVSFRLTSGVLSNIGLALLTNALVVQPKEGRMPLSLQEKITCDSSGNGFVSNQQIALDKPYFCFLFKNGIIQKKVTPLKVTQDGHFEFGQEYAHEQMIVDYNFYYGKQRTIYVLQKERFNGLFELQGKFYRKGQDDGVNRTSVFRMPKVRILSNLNIQLGTEVSPAISNFNIMATPYKTDYSDYSVMEIYNLDEDIC